MRVISNTSPLQYLYTIRHLSLLEQLYGQIIVPYAVVQELNIGKLEGYDVPDCRHFSWMHVETIPVPEILKLISSLGAGEAEVLALALAKPTDFVILDDGLARQIAASQSIPYTGTLGVLIEAKQCGLIPAVMPLVSELQRAGFHSSQALRNTIQHLVDE